MSVGRRTLRIWAAAVGLVAVGDAVVLAGSTLAMAPHRAPMAEQGLLAHVAGSPIAVVALLAATLAAIALFFRWRGGLVAGLAAVVGMQLLFRSFATVYDVHHQDHYQAGAALLGWFAGRLYARGLGIRAESSERARLEADRFGATGALASLAATYISAGASKLAHGGASWATTATLRLMILSHSPVDTGSWLASLRGAVSASDGVAHALAAATLVIQLGAFALLLGARARMLWGALLLALHTGILVLSGIFFVAPMALVIAFAYPWERGVDARRDDDDAAAALPDGGRERRGVTLACFAAVLVVAGAWARPSKPVAADGDGAPPGRAKAPLGYPDDARALLDGLSPGDVLAGWTVVAVGGPRDRALVLEVARDGTSFMLEVVRAGVRPFSSPHVTARYAIFYTLAPAQAAVSPRAYDEVTLALAARVSRTEERVPTPAGM